MSLRYEQDFPPVLQKIEYEYKVVEENVSSGTTLSDKQLVSKIEDIINRHANSLNYFENFTADNKKSCIDDSKFHAFDYMIQRMVNAGKIDLLEQYRNIINDHMNKICATRKNKIKIQFNFLPDVEVMKFF